MSHDESVGDRWDRRAAQRSSGEPKPEPTPSQRLASSLNLANWVAVIGLVVLIIAGLAASVPGVVIGSAALSLGLLRIVSTIAWGVIELVRVAER